MAARIRQGVKTLRLSDGLHLAYQEWGVNHTKKVVALHGWLDNSNTYQFLGPYLAERGYHVLAIDHVGHGLSDHLGSGASYSISKSMSCVNDFIYALGWPKFHLMGHSMGASISMMYAATMHEFVDKLVLIEGFGPVTELSEDASHNLRKALDSERRMRLKANPPKLYSTFSDAISARVNVVSTYPGTQYLSREAAKILVARGTKVANEDGSSPYKDIEHENTGPVTFRHDKRLVLPSYLYHSDEQVLSYAAAITSPTLLIVGKHGWPLEDFRYKARKNVMDRKGLLTVAEQEGSHHLHLDPIERDIAAQHIVTFLDHPAEVVSVGAKVSKGRIEM